MKRLLNKQLLSCVFVLLAVYPTQTLKAQTDMDAIMMAKHVFCGGLMYTGSTWTNYWEGDFKRSNKNLGMVTTSGIGIMGAYGISKKLNILAGIPYIKTKGSVSNMRGDKGLQDVSLWLKWKPVKTKVANGTFSLFALGGYSFPATNYQADYLPFSIGLRSCNLSGRLMLDYEKNKWFATASGTYIHRNNITIDRVSYYTTELHQTNRVFMPNVLQLNVRAGYRSKRLILEAVGSQWRTLGGFDISKNNMPFPSNKMIATTAGINFKYELKSVKGLSFTGGSNYTLSGRNVGQSTNVNGGIFYIIDFNRHNRKAL